MLLRQAVDSPRNERGGGQVSRLLLAGGDFGSQSLSVTWVECAPGSQQDLHAHRGSEQAYVIIAGQGAMIVGDEEQDVTVGTMVFIPPGQAHAIRNTGDQKLVYVSATSPPFAVQERNDETWLPAERSAASQATPVRMDPAHHSSNRDVAIVAFEHEHLAGVIGLFAAQRWSYADDDERTWRALTAPGSACVVAVIGGTVVGVAHVLSDGEIQAFLSILLVAQAFRRQGIGRALVRDAFARAGTRRIDLTSCADEFYAVLGFRRLTAFRLSRDEL